MNSFYPIISFFRNLEKKDEIFPITENNFNQYVKNRLELVNDEFKALEQLELTEKELVSLNRIKGAIEDVKSAIDVRPALISIFGSGYPKC
jgi:hypothetical protein